MKKLTAVISFAIVFLFVSVGSGKPSYKKDVGLDCASCHVADKKAANPTNALWKKAKDHAAKLTGDKKTCGDCHKGKSKP